MWIEFGVFQKGESNLALSSASKSYEASAHLVSNFPFCAHITLPLHIQVIVEKGGGLKSFYFMLLAELLAPTNNLFPDWNHVSDREAKSDYCKKSWLCQSVPPNVTHTIFEYYFELVPPELLNLYEFIILNSLLQGSPLPHTPCNMKLSLFITFLSGLLALVATFSPQDHEIFRLRDEIEANEGAEVTFYGILVDPISVLALLTDFLPL